MDQFRRSETTADALTKWVADTNLVERLLDDSVPGNLQTRPDSNTVHEDAVALDIVFELADAIDNQTNLSPPANWRMLETLLMREQETQEPRVSMRNRPEHGYGVAVRTALEIDMADPTAMVIPNMTAAVENYEVNLPPLFARPEAKNQPELPGNFAPDASAVVTSFHEILFAPEDLHHAFYRQLRKRQLATLMRSPTKTLAITTHTVEGDGTETEPAPLLDDIREYTTGWENYGVEQAVEQFAEDNS